MNSNNLRLIFLETTRACNLECSHCRASAEKEHSPLELTTKEIKKLIDEAASFSKPILVFSGGEPLLRDDIYELISYADDKGLKATMATNATLVTEVIAKKLSDSGTKMIAVSLYGATAESHDRFCGEKGAFNKTLKGIENIKKLNIPLQINTTITKNNLNKIEEIGTLALNLGADAYHIFFLVPTGRGKSIKGDEISPQEYEEAFNRLYDLHINFPIRIKATCAPHYYRVFRQRSRGGKNKSSFESKGFNTMTVEDTLGMPGVSETVLARGFKPRASGRAERGPLTKGCLAGQSVCFISYKGKVFGCGYLPINAGDLRKQDFKSIWLESGLFKTLRDDSQLNGRCGVCEFKKVCGGCRARAYAQTGKYLDEEPYCIYIPKKNRASHFFSINDRSILNRLQSDFPISSRPYKVIADELALSEKEVFNRVKYLVDKGFIRRIGANFDSRKLNYKSTLIALSVPDKEVNRVADLVSKYNGVTHNYLRNDDYNLWFTLIAPSNEVINDIITEIKSRNGIKSILSLPMAKQFKINGVFHIRDNSEIKQAR